MKIFKYKKTMIGLSILCILLIVSLLYPLYGPKDFNKVVFLYDEKGDLVGVPPLSPNSDFPLGSDRNGQDILLMILYGAKFTLLTAFSVAILRVLVGGVLGIVFSLWLKRIQPIFKDVLLVFKIVPPIIMTIFLMRRVSFYIVDVNVFNILLYQVIILSIIGIPSVLFMTAGIIDELKGKSFIQSSYLMGGGHFHVLKKQFLPYLKSYGVLMLVQQLLHTLTLVMYLGVYQIYIGGISKDEVRGADVLNSNAKEWAGLVGQNIYEFFRAPHIVLVPLICYFIIIIIINMMKKELESSMSLNPLAITLNKKRSKQKQTANDFKKVPITSSDFTLQKDFFS